MCSAPADFAYCVKDLTDFDEDLQKQDDRITRVWHDPEQHPYIAYCA